MQWMWAGPESLRLGAGAGEVLEQGWFLKWWNICLAPGLTLLCINSGKGSY